LQADHISVNLGPGNTVTNIQARGSVVLKGSMGEGWGEALDLDPRGNVAHWVGKVRGRA
jgi:hypothetical protein